MMRRPSLAGTAYHEAGNAVMAHYFGVRLKRATIVPDNAHGNTGAVHHEAYISGADMESYSDWMGRARLRAERLILVSLAGAAAQRVHAPRSYRSHHDESDRRSAWNILERISTSARHARAWYAALSISADDMMRRPLMRLQVESVARALLEKKNLSRDEIRTAIFAARA